MSAARSIAQCGRCARERLEAVYIHCLLYLFTHVPCCRKLGGLDVLTQFFCVPYVFKKVTFLVGAFCVMIPLVPNRQMDEESAMTLWKKNIASWHTTDRRRGAHPDKIRAGKRDLVDTKVRMRRITARIDTEAEDAEEQLSIARLVSAKGGTWGYDKRAGRMTVT